ncbi:FeoB-associated Cys-rich membrane protein [Tenacibaculum sp. MAR_2010_89]|uniref:FeoB-associated Cys-rich membrane protein n=1 Tax=Tenacibaculum sp. MAR_2010_89 TaxID=1250198 RepID=UPI003514D847
MAYNTIGWYGSFSLCSSINILSNFKLMQEIITYSIVVLAVVFLVRKFFFKTKKDTNCNKGCNCG